MADQKISELDAKVTLADTDLVPMVDIEAEPDKTKKITGANIKAQVLAGHKDLTTGVHGLAALHAAGFHSAGQAVNKVIWKDASERALADTSRTTTLDWTDLDLTAFTSASAKIALIQPWFHVDAWTSGKIAMYFRKNGTTPTYFIQHEVSTPVAGLNYFSPPFLIGMDAGQVIEYLLEIGGVAQADFYIEVFGYME